MLKEIVLASSLLVSGAVTPEPGFDYTDKENWGGVVYQTSVFSDVNKRLVPHVSFLEANKIVKGITPTTFGVDLEVKRGDTVVMLSKALKVISENSTSPYSDVNKRQSPYFNGLIESGIIIKDRSSFGVDQPTSRGELARWIYQALDGGKKYSSKEEFFTDTKIFQGDIDESYSWERIITRGEAAVVFSRMVHYMDGTLVK